MVQRIERAMADFARYAEEVKGDSQKAVRVRGRARDIVQFLQDEDLASINPASAIEDFRWESATQKRYRYTNHLAAVAHEALRVEGEEFVHSTKASVVRALKRRIQEGDLNIIPSFKDKTLARQVYLAGNWFDSSWKLFRLSDPSILNAPISSVVARDDFERSMRYEGWRTTLRHVGEIMPDANSFDIYFMLTRFSKVGQLKSIRERLTEARRTR